MSTFSDFLKILSDYSKGVKLPFKNFAIFLVIVNEKKWSQNCQDFLEYHLK